MPNDVATADIDTEALSSQLAGDLGSDLGIEAETDTTTVDDATDSLVDGAAGTDPADTPAGDGRDPATGRFTGKAPAAPAADPKVAPATAAPAAAADEFPVPQSWKKEMHPHWAPLPKEVKAYYNEREKQMLDGIAGYKTDAEYGKTIRGVATPYEGLLKQQGIEIHDAVGYLFRAHSELSTGTKEQKLAYLGKIAATYGVELPSAAAADPNAPAPAQLPPEVQQRLEAIENQFNEEAKARHQQRQTEVAREVDAFASDPNNTYFEECADHIVKLLKADPSQKLGDVYQTAVWANPVTRQKEIAKLEAAWKKDFLDKAKAAATTARKGTAANVRGRDTTRTPQAPAATIDNLDDVMRETHEEIKSRVD